MEIVAADVGKFMVEEGEFLLLFLPILGAFGLAREFALIDDQLSGVLV